MYDVSCMIVVIVGRGPWEPVNAIITIIIIITTELTNCMASSRADLVIVMLDIVMVAPLNNYLPRYIPLCKGHLTRLRIASYPDADLNRFHGP